MYDIIKLLFYRFIYLRVIVAEQSAPDPRFKVEIFVVIRVVEVTVIALDKIFFHYFMASEYVVHLEFPLLF